MQAQGRAMLRGQLNRQTSGLTAGQQFAGLRTILPQGLSLQTSGNLQLSGQLTVLQQQAALQTALARTTNLLNLAVQQGGSPTLINQLSALQQQIAGLLGTLESGSAF
jgi:hypothetical protein